MALVCPRDFFCRAFFFFCLLLLFFILVLLATCVLLLSKPAPPPCVRRFSLLRAGGGAWKNGNVVRFACLRSVVLALSSFRPDTRVFSQYLRAYSYLYLDRFLRSSLTFVLCGLLC